MAEKTAVLALLIAAFIWAMAGVSYKLFLAAGFTLAIIFWVSRLFKLLAVLGIAYYKKIPHMGIESVKDLKFVVLNALFSLGTPLFFVLALEQTTLPNVYFLNYTMPAWVFIFAAFFLGEKINAKKIFAVLLTLLGIFFIASPESIFSVNPGIIFGVLSALSFSGDIITSRELKDYRFHTVSIYSNALQLLAFSVIVLAFFPESFAVAATLPLDWLAALAFAGALLGYASDLYYYALEKIEASAAAMVSLSELFFASALALLIFGTKPLLNELAGYALILVSVSIFILRKSDIEYFEYLLHFRKRH